MTDELADGMRRFQTCIEQRDRVSAEALLHEDYVLVLVHPLPAIMTRSRWLEVLPDYHVHHYRVEEKVVDVDVDGRVAVVLQRVEMTATVLGADRSGTFVMTDVWRLHPDGWVLWRRHSTPLTAGAMPRR